METARYISFSIAARAQLADEAPLSSSSSHLRDGSLNPLHDRYPRFILSLSFSFIVIHLAFTGSSLRLGRKVDLESPRLDAICRVNIRRIAGIFEHSGEISSRVNLNKPRFPSKTGKDSGRSFSGGECERGCLSMLGFIHRVNMAWIEAWK